MDRYPSDHDPIQDPIQDLIRNPRRSVEIPSAAELDLMLLQIQRQQTATPNQKTQI